MVQEQEQLTTTQFLSFRISGEEYGVGILRVREIIEYDTVTRVPGTPPSIRGVINLRGHVVPVIDLVVRFGGPPTRVSRRTCIVIVELEVEGESTPMGIIADEVCEVVDFHDGDIEEAPSFGTAVKVDYLIGMGKSGKNFVLLLDIDKVLRTSDLQVLHQLSREHDDDSEGDSDSNEAGEQEPRELEEAAEE